MRKMGLSLILSGEFNESTCTCTYHTNKAVILVIKLIRGHWT